MSQCSDGQICPHLFLLLAFGAFHPPHFDVEAASVLNSGHLWSPKGRQTLIEMCSHWWATWFIITHNFPLKGSGCGADGGGCLHGGWLSPKRNLWRLAFIYNIRHGKNWLMRNENPGFLVLFNFIFRLVSHTTKECYVSRCCHTWDVFPKQGNISPLPQFVWTYVM